MRVGEQPRQQHYALSVGPSSLPGRQSGSQDIGYCESQAQAAISCHLLAFGVPSSMLGPDLPNPPSGLFIKPAPKDLDVAGTHHVLFVRGVPSHHLIAVDAPAARMSVPDTQCL